MSLQSRIPGQLNVPTRFFGQFTPKDLIRIGLPSLVAGSTLYPYPELNGSTIGTLFAGILLGVTWYGWRPYSRPFDTHVFNAARWLVEKRSTQGSDLADGSEDHVVTQDGVVVGVIKISPTNLEMKTDAEQGALHRIYQDLLETVTYPIYIYSRQQHLNLTPYIRHVGSQNVSPARLQEGYLDYCQALSDRSNTVTDHYIVLRVDRNSRRWLQNKIEDLLPVKRQREQNARVHELDSRIREVIDTVDTADLTAERVTGQTLHNLIKQSDTSDPNPGITWCRSPNSHGLGKYRRTVYVEEFPASMELGWPLQLLRTNGLVDVTQVIKPKNPSKTSKKLQRLSEKLNAEIDSFLRQGYRGTNKLESLLDDVEWFLDLLANRQDQPVDYGVYITAHSQDPDQCRQTFKQVCNRLQTMQVEYRQPVFRTDQAYFTDSLIHGDRLQESMLMPAGSAATGFPFATQDPDQYNGVIFGVDSSDDTPLLLDRYSWSSHSMARMGMVGSGKSYAAKIELLRAYLAYPDLQIIIVDPKKEYTYLVRALGGNVHTLEPDTDYSFDNQVVGFEVKQRGQLDNVELLVDIVQQIYSAVSQNREKTLVLIDEARILMNDERGRHVLNQFVLEGRDTNTAITLISQNASHFTDWREGREILDNMPGKVFMRHDRVGDSMIDYFDLSQREKQELYELKTGTDSLYSEALLKVSGRLDTRIKVESSQVEHALIEYRRSNP